ncbi:MAG: GT2 family glycosyltransferase [Polaribacter sp.]|jgi:GT2 family glycosyltransferase
MSDKLNKISILIPVYNRLEITKKGLESIYLALHQYEESGKGSIYFEIVVVDDGSTDGTSEWVAQNHPTAHIEKGDGNLWWTGSINKGAKFAIDILNSNYLLLWNDDVFPKKDYFIELEKIVFKKPKNVIIGSLIYIYNSNREIWSVGGKFNSLFGKLSMLNSIKSGSSEIIQCDWQPGMGTLIDADIIDSNNLWWDEKNFPQYFGDSDFVLRAKKKGVMVSTNLNLIAFNNIETTGHKGTQNFNEVLLALKSIKSIYNVKKNFLFFSRHGIIPFTYYEFIKKFIGYFVKYVKSQLKVN